MSRQVLGTEPTPLDIKGYVFAWRDTPPSPLILHFDGEMWVPVFANVRELTECMAAFNIKDYSVRQIVHGLDFLASIAENKGLRVCTNLRQHANGRLRFKWITSAVSDSP